MVVGYEVATALGSTLETTWEAAAQGRAGFRRLTRCLSESRSNIVGEIPDWDPSALPYVDRKEASLWNAAYVFLTMETCRRALQHAQHEPPPEDGHQRIADDHRGGEQRRADHRALRPEAAHHDGDEEHRKDDAHRVHGGVVADH